MELTVLGCSGSYPGPGEACSGYLVRTATTTLWVDAGPGTLANLQTQVDLAEVDGVVLTHGHPDHWADVMSFHIACKYHVERRGVPVLSPVRVRDLASEVNGAVAPTLDWQVVSGGDRGRVGDLTLTFSQTDHGTETLAVRIDAPDGRSVGYSADTGPRWALERLGDGLDLALCEATFTAEQEGSFQHLSARQAGQLAREAGAGRLVVTHFPPGIDRARQQDDASDAFGGPVEAAAQGARFTL